MLRKLPVLCLILLATPPARANDFPTRARVEYVLACLGGDLSRQAVHACSCRIDALASRMSHHDYIGVETALAMQSLPGERAAAIRGIGWVKDLVDRFRAAEVDAEFTCR